MLRALTALEEVPDDPSAACKAVALQTTRLVLQTHAELASVPKKSRKVAEFLDEFSERKAHLPARAIDAVTFLDSPGQRASSTAILDQHRRAAAAFGACPELRVALQKHVLASLPPESPAPPTCDAGSEVARQTLRDALAALERLEPTSGRSTEEYRVLASRLAELAGEGPTLSATRVRATSEADTDRAADSWATLARELPTCSPYLASKHDATIAAVTAWQAAGRHRVAAGERHALSKKLLDSVIKQIETDRGARATTLREYISLTQIRSALRPPPVQQPRIRPPEVALASKPAASARTEKWISRHRPERNVVEIGVIAGVMAPASGLLNNTNQSHELFDPAQEAMSDTTGTQAFYRPYRKVAAEIGARVTYYPLSFLGAEIEGGVMPTRVIEHDGSLGGRATLFNFRGHLIAQLPFWRITPFFLIGGGMIGTTGVLGKDIDPSLNLGGGVKFHVSRRLLLRLDLRENRSTRRGVDAGGTNYPEILLGLSVMLNRPRPGRQKPNATAGAHPRKTGGSS